MNTQVLHTGMHPALRRQRRVEFVKRLQPTAKSGSGLSVGQKHGRHQSLGRRLGQKHRVNFSLLHDISPRLFTALVLTLGILTAAAWLSSTVTGSEFLFAVLWAAGLIFLVQAPEAGGGWSKWLTMTGLLLPALTILGSEYAMEVGFVAAVVISGWLSTWILMARRPQHSG